MNLDRLQASRFTSGDIDIAWYEAGDRRKGFRCF
jgi:hypothetical protein